MKKLLLVLAIPLLAGCAVLRTPPQPEYRSNESILAEIATQLGTPSAEDFRLSGAEIRLDAITLHYVGVTQPGDRAWILRFSQKSGELAEAELTDLDRARELLADTRGFRELDVGTALLEDGTVSYLRYAFDAAAGPGCGIFATLRVEQGGEPIVVHAKLDNHGGRAALGWEDLQPLVQPSTTSREPATSRDSTTSPTSTAKHDTPTPPHRTSRGTTSA